MTDAQRRNHADELLAPGTPLYQTMADVTTVMYAGWMPVLLIPVLQPKAAQGVREHSRMFGAAKAQPGIEDGVGRVRDTLELVGGIVFAKQDGARPLTRFTSCTARCAARCPTARSTTRGTRTRGPGCGPASSRR